MSDAKCQMSLNPDIAGVGVRVAFYIQTILSYILSVFLPELLPETAAVALFTSSSLLVAALIQANSGNMSYLDYEVLYWLSWVPLYMVIAPYLAVATPERSTLRSKIKFGRSYCMTRATGWTLGTTYFILWCVWVWVVYTPYVVSGGEPTDTGCLSGEEQGGAQRNAGERAKAMTGVLIGMGMCVGICILLDLRQIYRISQTLWNNSNLESEVQSGNDGDNDSNEKDDGTERQENDIRPVGFSRIRKIVMVASRHQSLARIFLGTTAIYNIWLISKIEETITAKNIPIESNTWSYGQITALSAAILQSISSLYQFILKWRTRKEKVSGLQETNPEPGRGGSVAPGGLIARTAAGDEKEIKEEHGQC